MKGLKLEISQVFDAPIKKVWDAWTNPESLKEWMAPEGMTTPEVTVNFKKGGKYKIVMAGFDNPTLNAKGQASVGGKYLEIEKPQKLIFTWLWEGAPKKTHTTKVTILLKELAENRTEITLIHTGFADEYMEKEHGIGWGSTLRKLNNFLEKK